MARTKHVNRPPLHAAARQQLLQLSSLAPLPSYSFAAHHIHAPAASHHASDRPPLPRAALTKATTATPHAASAAPLRVPGATSVLWTESQDQRLLEGVGMWDGRQWNKIADAK